VCTVANPGDSWALVIVRTSPLTAGHRAHVATNCVGVSSASQRFWRCRWHKDDRSITKVALHRIASRLHLSGSSCKGVVG